MEQPAGTVEGSLTMFRSDGLEGGEWWQCSRHTLKNRTVFWERVYRGTPHSMMLVADRQTDEMWGRDTADEWLTSQATNRIRSGFKLSQVDGTPGPSSMIELLVVAGPTKTTPVRTNQ